ncbi:MAG: histidine kinase [Spirochaetaceae bacterium]
MLFEFENFDLLRNLISQGGMIAFFSFIFSRVKLFRKIFTKPKTTKKDKIILIIFFSGIGILGTYTGIPVKGALANTRVVGVFVGGLLGGPVVGLGAGIIAGVHRLLIDIDGFTATACMISTITEGLIASLLWKLFQKSSNKWLFASIFGLVAEIAQMLIILIVAKPFSDSVELVKIIGLPMIIGNAVAIGMFIAIADSIFREREKIAAIYSQKILKIAHESLPFFRQGFNYNTASKTAKIIYKELNLAAVSFTTTDICLTHIGSCNDHHLHGSLIKTASTRKVITDGRTYIANSKSEVDCSCEDCCLNSAVIVPLQSGNKIIGTLKLYRDVEYGISPSDVETAVGLASLFSLQIENSRIEEQARLLQNSELKALQSQINPHFLFNAINTVSSFIRTKPEKARDLLLDLSDYYRFRLHEPDEFIPIESELDHVKAYLDIEKARFGDKLEVNLCGKTDKIILVPPLILQPLVENAVKHGIQNSVTGGVVTISVEEKKDFVKIKVEDNGIGIEAKKLKTLLIENRGCVGLTNVHKRLLNVYGVNNGLKIDSKLGKGTKVCLMIPLV